MVYGSRFGLWLLVLGIVLSLVVQLMVFEIVFGRLVFCLPAGGQGDW